MTTSEILGRGSERWSSNPGQSPRTITFQTRQGLVFALKNPSITPGSCLILKDRISLINYSSNRERQVIMLMITVAVRAHGGTSEGMQPLATEPSLA